MTRPTILAKEVRTADDKGRLALGASKAGEQYQVVEATDGTITLVPVAVIPKWELWLHRNPEAMASARKGLADSAAGRTKSLGSFAQYAEDVDED